MKSFREKNAQEILAVYELESIGRPNYPMSTILTSPSNFSYAHPSNK